MGRQYYCDYCDKSFTQTADSVKKHVNGIQHKRLRDEYYARFEDESVILERERHKKPCRTFFETGHCHFSSSCRFSHYSQQQLEELHREVERKSRLRFEPVYVSYPQITFEDWLIDRRRRGLSFSESLQDAFVDGLVSSNSNIETAMPWNYPDSFDFRSDLPPSLRRLTLKNFENVTLKEWGEA